MSDNITYTIILSGVFLLLFISAEILYRRFNVKAELTRKYVHLSTGLLTMLFPPLVQDHRLVLLLCSSFLIILLASMRFHLLPSINSVDRKTRGSLLFPVIVYLSFLGYNYFGQYIFYYLPIIILALCDPLAALVGKRWPVGVYSTFGQTKTWIGSIVFFVTALIVSLILTIMVDDFILANAIVISLSVSFISTIAEAITHKGYDNLTIPASVVLVLLVLDQYAILI